MAGKRLREYIFLLLTKGGEGRREEGTGKKEKEEERRETDAAAGPQELPKERKPPGVDAAPTNPRGSPG